VEYEWTCAKSLTSDPCILFDGSSEFVPIESATAAIPEMHFLPGEAIDSPDSISLDFTVTTINLI
jgi:hypothetical protein